jgi:hypothetical protein
MNHDRRFRNLFAIVSLAACTVGVVAQNPQIQTSVEHPTDQLWFINARNADTRTVSIDGGMLSDCVEVTNCDGSGFSHNIILKPGESAHVGDVTRAICTNPTDDDGNEIHQCEKRPPTTFKYQVLARYVPNAPQPKPRSSNQFVPVIPLQNNRGAHLALVGGAATPAVTYAVAQATATPPTLQETLDWLKDELAAHGYLGAMANRLTAMDGCHLTISTDMNGSGFVNGDSINNAAFNLGDLDPTSVRAEAFAGIGTKSAQGVAFKTWSNKPLIVNSNSSSDPNNRWGIPAGPSTSWAIGLDSSDEAGRTAKAFIHAVEICGGKPALF